MATLRPDGVATGTGYLLAKEQSPSAAHVAASGQQRLQLLQTFDPYALGILQLSEQGLCRLPHPIGVTGEEGLESILAQRADHSG